MKNCPRCLIRYSDMWNICIVCKRELIKEGILSKIISRPRHSANYLFPIVERAIEQADALFLYLDRDLNPLMCNKAVEHITGHTRDEVFKGDWLDLFFKDNPARKEIFKAAITSCLNSIKSRAYEGAITKKDGSECILSWRSAAATDLTGKIGGILCTAHDITEYKSSDDDVATCSERLRDIFASIRDYAMITTNLKDKITYYGAGAVSLFGWQSDMTLKDISLLFVEEDKSAMKDRIKDSVERMGHFEEETTLSRSDNETFPATLTTSILLDRNNQKAGYIYVIRDITERKKIERQMVQNEKLAAIGQLATGVAHEINNPLLVILGRLDMLSMESEKNPAQIEQTLNTIKSQAEHMRAIIDRLLSYARRKPMHKDVIDINDVLKTISPLVAYHPEYKNITWKEELSPGLPKIEGDFNQLQEVFLNLAINACQAMPQGGTITMSSRVTHDGFIEAAIKDTGKGIKKEDLAKLFTPFFTTKDNGTGLGLAISHGIIASHGGRAEVESTLGKETVFRIKLPISVKKVTDVIASPEGAKQSQDKEHIP